MSDPVTRFDSKQQGSALLSIGGSLDGRGVWGRMDTSIYPAESLGCPPETVTRYQSAVLAKSLQPCLTLCDPTDCSPPGSSAHRILQTRILEWVAMPSSRESSRPREGTCIS